MSSLNQIQIIGNLGRDPETRYSHDGAAITNCSIAASEHWKSASGDKQEHTEWFRVVFFGRLGEIAGEYLKKGAQVLVSGRLRTRKYTARDGTEKAITEVHADVLRMLGDRANRGDGKPAHAAPPSQPSTAGGIGAMDDDVPF